MKESRLVREQKKSTKRAKSFLKYSLYFLAVCFVISSVYSGYEFVETHNFQTPVKFRFQNPTPRKSIKIESPVGSKSAGLVGQAYAEEIVNPFDPRSPKGIAWELVKNKWGVHQWESFDNIITNESGWNPYAMNPTSSAGGIAQALPYTKMNCELWDYECQLKWAVEYIYDRYDTPNKAWAFWQAQSPHWY